MHRRATASARSLDGGVLPQHRGNSRRIPDTVAVPGTVSGPHQEGSWHGGEGVGHQDLAGASLQHQNMLGGETLEGCADVVRRRRKRGSRLRYGREKAFLHDVVVDVPPNFVVESGFVS